MQRKTLYSLMCGIYAASSALPTIAEGTSPSAKPALEQVIVTARRDEELIQQVPLAVTALSAESLERQGIQSADQLLLQVPSLSQDIQGAQKSTTLFTIRGVGTEDALIPMDMAVGVYFAEAPQARPGGFSKTFFDLANVQVLKGPQGTLFGRNTTGGAILVEPKAPVDHFEADVKLTHVMHELGNGNEGYGMLNFPAGDKVAVRFAGKVAKRDGFYKNVVTGEKSDDEDYQAYRGSVRINPTDALETTFIYDYYHADDNGTAIQLKSGSGLFAGSDAFQKTLKDNEFQSELGSGLPNTYGPAKHRLASFVENQGITNRTTYEINDNFRIKNVISHRKLESHDWVDFDGTFAVAPSSGIGFSAIASRSDVDNKAWSEELQFQGTSFDNRLTWVVGGFYFNEKGTDLSESTTFGSPGNISGGDGENTSYAIFGQGTYEFPVDGLSLTLGLRNTWDKRDFTIQGTTYGSNPAVSIPKYLTGAAPICRQRAYDDPANPDPRHTHPKSLADCATTTTGDADEYTYNITLNYQIDPDKLVYVAHRRGYRTFAFNPRAEMPADFEPVPAEIVKDIELGLKADWDIGVPLRTNVALFYSKFDNMQRQRVVIAPSGAVGTVLLSAQETHVQGAELEFTLLPIEGLNISGYYSYTEGAYDKFDVPTLAGPVDLSNADEFNRFPKDKAGLTVSYTLPLAAELGEVSAQLGYVWQGAAVMSASSNVQLDPSGSSSDIPFGKIDAYGLVNARIDWKGIYGTRFDLALFGTNLADERYNTDILSLSAGAAGRFTAGPLGEPRVIGLEAGYHFE